MAASPFFLQRFCSNSIFLFRDNVILSVSGLADQLGHRAHRAADAPAAGLEQDHGKQAEDGGGQHDALKPERELGDAGGKEGSMISPVPR